MSRHIILASTSPRRKALLKQIGLKFKVRASKYEEDMTLPLEPRELVQILAHGKASDIAALYPESIVIGADTVVVVEGKVLGKPKDAEDAKRMLRMLSGTKHQVVTGLAVLCVATKQEFKDASVANIYMREVSDTEIDDYIASGEPMDKAGAYAVQGMGAQFIERIEGDYSGIVGLPLVMLHKFLIQITL